MTITNAIPQLWSARLLAGLNTELVWPGLVNDISGEFADGGDRLNLSEITTAVSVRDYDRNTNIANPQTMTDEGHMFVLDQQKYFNIQIDDLDRTQAKPALLDAFAVKAARAVAFQIDEHIRSAHRDAAKIEADDGANGILKNRFEFQCKVPNPDIEGRFVTKNIDEPALEWEDDLVECFIKEIATLAGTANARGWQGGRYMTIHNNVATRITQWLALTRGVGTGSIADAAMTNATLTNLFGFNTRVDVSDMIDEDSPGNGAYARLGMSEGLLYASQVAKVEAYRPDNRFSDALKGLYLYHAEVIQSDRVMSVGVNA